MRKLVAGLFITLDGVIEDPNIWTVPYHHSRIDQTIGSIMGGNDAMLIGRQTYEDFAAYWPHQTGPLADVMNGTPKYVVSQTLDKPAWQNCTVIRGDVAAEVRRLKEQPGRGIGVTGSATLIASLVRDGLIDELTLFLVPIVRGYGKRLFADNLSRQAAESAVGCDPVALELRSSEQLDNGVVILTYVPAPSGAGEVDPCVPASAGARG
jgi:dihydrofolate reductase